MDSRFLAFDIFLEPLKIKKERKPVTKQIVTKEDIENVLAVFRDAQSAGSLENDRALQYSTFILLRAYSGQRPKSTLARITVSQVRDALSTNKASLHILPNQDKIRMEHWVPIRPRLISSLYELCANKTEDEPVFNFNSIQLWLKRYPVSLPRCTGRFIPSDLRKFTEQYGDIIQWDHSNRSYILTHDVPGVDWTHYKHPFPEYVYEIYMKEILE